MLDFHFFLPEKGYAGVKFQFFASKKGYAERKILFLRLAASSKNSNSISSTKTHQSCPAIWELRFNTGSHHGACMRSLGYKAGMINSSPLL